MDTVTHGIVGALIGKAFFADDPSPLSPGWTEKPRTPGRVAIISATVGAMFPDIDVLFGRLTRDPMFYLTHHRGVTHSLVMLPIWAVALAALTYGLAQRAEWPSPTFRTLTIIYAVAIGSHIFLDLITSYGIMLWAPINHTRYAWDWVLIIDLILTALALLPQLSAWAFHKPKIAALRALPMWVACCAVAFGVWALVGRLGIEIPGLAIAVICLGMTIFLVMPLRHGLGPRMRRGKWCRTGIALVGVYLVFTAILHANAVNQTSRFAQDNRMNAISVAALPMPPSLASWSGIIATQLGYYRLQFNEFDSAGHVNIQFFRNPEENAFIAQARQLPGVQTFLWFARFPLFEYSVENGQNIVWVIDLRFLSDGLGGPAMGPNGMPRTIFAYRVVFAADGQVISAGLERPD